MGIGTDVAALSLRDLLEAREAYHVHLVRQRHVVATAVGRYLARAGEADPGPTSAAERLALQPGMRAARTLDAVSVEPWSWPCVLVFVDRWMTADEIGEAPDEMVPRRLYLPDGRAVPTCVVQARPATAPPDPRQHLSFPTRTLGGGFACLSEVQGRSRVGSIGCLVSDGLKVYALTNRHVAGEQGTVLSTALDGATVPIGRAAARAAARVPFEQAYEGLPGARMELAIDAALVDIDDVNAWTTQVFGLGAIADTVDVGPETLALDLLGAPLRAFGAASGPLSGQLLGLFYRYRTRSGVEYLADAIVGPRPGAGPLGTQPGDSGTLWVLDPGEPDAAAPPPPLRALALQWGGARFAGGSAGDAGPHALVTFLSTACRALDVEPVYDWNADHELYWGEVGHYTVGARACDLVRPAELREFFVANRGRIAFDLPTIADGGATTPRGTRFFPLADVPDTRWRFFRRDRAHEGPNHFADMDDPVAADDPTTLLSLYEQDEASVAPSTWLDFYVRKGVDEEHMGLLPFRIAQLYRLIVDALGEGDVDTALASAGVMSHYVGDSCQPLHVSHLHHGHSRAEGAVHADYETRMVFERRRDLVRGLDAALAGLEPPSGTPIVGHEAAARAVVALMRRTVERLPPEDVVAAWVDARGSLDELWDEVGERSIACIADGSRTLAALWSSAWAEAGAAAPPPAPRDPDALMDRVHDGTFAPSLFLRELAGVLPWSAPVPTA